MKQKRRAKKIGCCDKTVSPHASKVLAVSMLRDMGGTEVTISELLLRYKEDTSNTSIAVNLLLFFWY